MIMNAEMMSMRLLTINANPSELNVAILVTSQGKIILPTVPLTM